MRKSNLKIIIPIIVLVIVAIVVMMYKYFEMKNKLVMYEDIYNIYSKLKEQEVTISGKDIITNLELTNTELKEELVKYKNKYEEVYLKLEEYEKKLEEYRNKITNNSIKTACKIF